MIGIKLSKKSIDTIIYFEISSPSYYQKFLQHPTWPKGESGVTIGVGYDCGYNTAEQIKSDWAAHISIDSLIKLQSAAGLKGDKANNAISSLKDIVITLDAAKNVFLNTTLKRFSIQLKTAFTGVEDLMPDAQGGLLSLVFNRGSNTSNTDRRIEMHNIIPLVASKDYNGIAQQITNMKRLWGQDMKGLLDRRDAEAKLVKESVREYSQDEIIEI